METESSIDEETKRRLKEAALADELARSGQMKQLGADYILEGHISKLGTQREKIPKVILRMTALWLTQLR